MTKVRNVPLDIFRGLVILNMMFVDAPPDFENIYAFFKHSPWEGITFADLAFPGFVFAMGASLAFSLSAKLRKRERIGVWFKKVLRRTLILFFLGILFNALPQIFNFFITSTTDFFAFFNETVNHLRIFGVLQRLALVYFFASLIIKFSDGKNPIFFAFVFLIISSIGFHLYSPKNPFLPENNLSIFLDLSLVGENHILYNNPLYEPEGLYGSLASISSMIFGFSAAKFLIEERYRALIFFGSTLIFLGGVWSVFDIVGKPLWTSPYVLFTAGFDVYALTIIAALYKKFQYDIQNSKVLNKIYYSILGFGKNPIFFYLATNFIIVLLYAIPIQEGNYIYFYIYQISVKGVVSDAFSSSLFAFIWCVLWFPLAYCFYKKDIVIKI